MQTIQSLHLWKKSLKNNVLFKISPYLLKDPRISKLYLIIDSNQKKKKKKNDATEEKTKSEWNMGTERI